MIPRRSSSTQLESRETSSRSSACVPYWVASLTRNDDTAGSERVLVITHGLWQRRYGGAVDVVGRRLTVAAQRFVIVGVMPPDVEYPRGVDAWMTVEARVTLTSNPTFQEATRNELDWSRASAAGCHRRAGRERAGAPWRRNSRRWHHPVLQTRAPFW